MMPPWRWTVVEADLNPTRGSEQRGRRPVLIVSDEDHNVYMTTVTIVPFTSTRRSLYAAEVRCPAGVAGQPLDSIVMAHQVRTIAKERLGRVYGVLQSPTLQLAVLAALAEHLMLDEFDA